MRILCEAAEQSASAECLKRNARDASTGELVAILSEAESLAPVLRKRVEECVVVQTHRIAKNVPDENDDTDDIAGNGVQFLEKMTSVIKRSDSGIIFAKSWQNLLTIVSFLPATDRAKSLISLIELIPNLPNGEIRANGFHDAASRIIAADPKDQCLLSERLTSTIASLSTDIQKVKAIQQVLLLLRGIPGADISKHLGGMLEQVWSLENSIEVIKYFKEIGYVAQSLGAGARLAVINTLSDTLPKLASKRVLGSGIEFLMSAIQEADPVTYRSVSLRIENSLNKIAEQIYHGIETGRALPSQRSDFDELFNAIQFLPADLQRSAISSLTEITLVVANKNMGLVAR